jgi:two-component system OmpR family response regulator
MKKKILTIDDDPDFQSALCTMLENANFECIKANSSRRGLESAAEENPDLIILDVMMEDISAGFRFVKILREMEEDCLGRHIPVLMVSSIQKLTNLQFQDRTASAMLPVDGFLDKPVTPEILIKKIHEMLKNQVSDFRNSVPSNRRM